jgi:hypothetical protein
MGKLCIMGSIYFQKHFANLQNYVSILLTHITESGTAMKLIRLIKMCLNEHISKIHIGTHLSDAIPFQKALKQGKVVPVLS